ncbi:MAG: M14 family murein peptide amidase A [Gammaproteobacteria bacterium]|nr:M14 family murein peptide amidase A [Gammaproteobacteria bacterium]
MSKSFQAFLANNGWVGIFLTFLLSAGACAEQGGDFIPSTASSPVIPTTTSMVIEDRESKSGLHNALESRKQASEVCRKIASKLSSVKLADCQKKEIRTSGGMSVDGVPIILQEYPPIEGKESKGRVLILGGIHGDELSSISIVFNWMRTLDKYHSGMFHWHVVPLVNPDGLFQKTPQRMNKNGVDLNRNFPTDNWHKESNDYWHRTNKNPRRYPGPSPLSEPESKWLAKEISEFKPDAIVSIHAPYGILDFDGPRSAPKRLGHLHLNLLGTYPGSLGNYAGVHQEIPVVTIELPFAGIMPTERQMNQIWTDLIKWLSTNVNDKPAVMQVMNEKAQTDPS